jgi:F-type H+-transporting ATPase subunit gamma
VPNLKDIKRRIVTVQKTQQITSAMRMVAASKLRRATEAIEAARPYADRMRQTLAEVAAAQTDAAHPLLEARDRVKSLALVVITSDRGLAGGFNSNVLKRAEAFLAEREPDLETVRLITLGRKAKEYFRRRRAGDIVASHELPGWVTYEQAAGIARDLAERYVGGEVDEVVLVFSELISTMTQTPTAACLMPLSAGAQATSDAKASSGADKLPHTIEPSPEHVLALLAPMAIEVEVFRALLENQAGEHAARMTAMESATRNTEELIEKLTLDFNRARQAAITSELVEIVTGAQALE